MARRNSVKQGKPKLESVRERAEKEVNQKPKPRRLRKTAGTIKKSLGIFSVLLQPFKVGPLRKIARVVGRVLFPRFLRNAFKELKTVTWPGRRDTWKLTLAVFMFALVFGILVTATDYGLDKVFRKVLLK